MEHAPGFSAPITDDERCHVTQPRARINVSCSRAGLKGATGGSGNHLEGASEGWEGWKIVPCPLQVNCGYPTNLSGHLPCVNPLGLVGVPLIRRGIERERH